MLIIVTLLFTLFVQISFFYYSDEGAAFLICNFKIGRAQKYQVSDETWLMRY